jgi:hypothetical protein
MGDAAKMTNNSSEVLKLMGYLLTEYEAGAV